jgi:hypothetical protein
MECCSGDIKVDMVVVSVSVSVFSMAMPVFMVVIMVVLCNGLMTVVVFCV